MGSLRASLIFLYLLSASTAVVSQPQTKAVTLFDGHEVASIVCDTDANVPIAKAASLLAGDLLKLTGRKASIAATPNKMGRVAIMVGLATEPAVSAVLKEQHQYGRDRGEMGELRAGSRAGSRRS